MSCQVYGPTKKVSGGAAFIETSIENQCFFVNFVKQTGYNEQDNKGIFVDGPSFKLKFSINEAAGIVSAVENKSEWKFFHNFEENKSSGRFSYYAIPGTDNQGKETLKEGFGFAVKKDDIDIRVGVSMADARMISQYLINSLNWIFNNDIDNDKRKQEEYFKQKEAEAAAAAPKGKSAPKKQKEEPAPEVPSTDDPPF